MVQELILELLLSRKSIFLHSVGVLSLDRHWAQFSANGSQIIPPFDNLVIQNEDQVYDINIVEAISLQNGFSFDQGYRAWCDYLALEAVDGVLTIEGVAMIDIGQLEIIALDPHFAEQLSPDTEILELTSNGFTIQNTVCASNKPIRNAKAQIPKTNNVGFLSYIALILAIASALYLLYFFAL